MPENSRAGIERQIEPFPDPFKIDHAKWLTDAIAGTTFSGDRWIETPATRDTRAAWYGVVYGMCRRALEAADPYNLAALYQKMERERVQREIKPTIYLKSEWAPPPLNFRNAISAAWRAAWEKRW